MIEIKDVEKLAELSRINICNEEKEIFSREIELILNYVDQIKSVNEEMNDEKSSEESELKNIFREDGHFHRPGQFTEDLLESAPEKENSRVKVKKII